MKIKRATVYCCDVGRAQAVLTPSAFKTARRFARFHEQNPHVYETLVWLARKGRRAGAKRLGAKQLYEVCRYELMIQSNGKPYKLSNSFTAPYARLVMQTNPDLRGIFVIRGEDWRPLLWEDIVDHEENCEG